MANVKKRKKKTLKKAAVISKKVRDYSNNPHFVKKAETVQEILKKHGLPQD